jgi:CYTH domain-containing protein
MGCVTPILINNDQFHELIKNPQKFVDDISVAMNSGERITGAQVHMAMHSSQFQLYALEYTSLIPLDIYHKDFKDYASKNKKHLISLLRKSKTQLDEAIRELESKSSVEIERRFLVTDKTILANRKGFDMMQGYIKGDMTIRVRVSGYIAYLTLKGPKKGCKCDEYEYQIPLEEAKDLIAKYCKTTLRKTRYEIEYGDLTIEVDVFKDYLKGLIIAEVELPSEDTQFELPSWFGREITHDHSYSNVRLAERNKEYAQPY